MTIETRFDIDDYVWFMYGGTPDRWPVKKISVTVQGNKKEIVYSMNIGVLWRHKSENELFPTKEALIQSL